MTGGGGGGGGLLLTYGQNPVYTISNMCHDCLARTACVSSNSTTCIVLENDRAFHY